MTHIWQEYLDLVEQIRKTDRAKEIYAQRKETIERVFVDAKERHAMRYTHHRGLAAVTRWVRLMFVLPTKAADIGCRMYGSASPVSDSCPKALLQKWSITQ